MEEIKIRYNQDFKIGNEIEKIIDKFIQEKDYKYKIIFIDNEGENIDNYEQLGSYKLLMENMKNLNETIQKEKKEFSELQEKIRAKFSDNNKHNKSDS